MKPNEKNYPMVEETSDFGAIINFNKPGAQRIELSPLEVEYLYDTLTSIMYDEEDDEYNYSSHVKTSILLALWLIFIGFIFGCIFNNMTLLI